eukprot:symbB.v1.2.037286.t1/scaffold5465.1/size26854/1
MVADSFPKRWLRSIHKPKATPGSRFMALDKDVVFVKTVQSLRIENFVPKGSAHKSSSSNGQSSNAEPLPKGSAMYSAARNGDHGFQKSFGLRKTYGGLERSSSGSKELQGTGRFDERSNGMQCLCIGSRRPGSAAGGSGVGIKSTSRFS